MTDWFERPVTAWRYRSSGEGEPGLALSPELLHEEARYGPTCDVVWAYAEALPALLGDAIPSDVTPLGFARGRLTAAVVETPVFIAGLEYVQTCSPEVCRLYAGSVPWFKVAGRACVEALARAKGAVRRVDVCVTEPFELDADFELRFQWGGPDTVPRWYRSLPTAPFLIPVAQVDDDVWLCWDRDHHRPRIVEAHGRFHDRRTGPRDVQPEPSPPPWAALEDAARGGEGWAATAARVGQRAVSSVDARDRRWLSLSTFDCDVDALHEAWRGHRPLGPLARGAGRHAGFVSLELDEGAAKFDWIGLHRLLRVRAGRVEQLTIDHDLHWLAAQQSMNDIPEEAFASMTNVMTKSLPEGDPDHGKCEIDRGDRFVLLHASTHRLLEEEAHGELASSLGRGSVRQVARWIRTVLLRAEHQDVVVVIDAGAVVRMRDAGDEPPSSVEAGPIEVTVNDLVHFPERHHRQHIRCRGIFHSRFEGMRFADAWFRCRPTLPDGAWLVDVEGQWLHDGTNRGHMGQDASELVGSATKVSITNPRVVPESEILGARRYTPLRSDVTLQQRLQGWTWRGDRWLHRLGPGARLPEPTFPVEVRATITWMVDGFLQLGLFSWTVHETAPLVPEPAEPTDEIPAGKLVVVQGILRWPEPGGRTRRDGAAEPRGSRRLAEIRKRAAYVSTTEGYSNWPALDGVLCVVLPSFIRSHQRYALPEHRLIENARDKIGRNTLVTIVGEMADTTLFALSIESSDGPIDI